MVFERKKKLLDGLAATFSKIQLHLKLDKCSQMIKIIKTILTQILVHQTSLLEPVPVHPPAGCFLPLNITPLTSHYLTTCYIYSSTNGLPWLHYNDL